MEHIITGKESDEAPAKDASKYDAYVNKNLQLTKKDLSESYSDDVLLVISIRYFDDLQKNLLDLSSRLRELYSYFNPELIHDKEDLEIAQTIIQAKGPKSAMGGRLSTIAKQQVYAMANNILQLLKHKNEVKEAIQEAAQQVVPNTTAIVGPEIATRLIKEAGSLKKLSRMPSSTIQLLGAQKALFRHMLKGTKNPKYGIIFTHPLIKNSIKHERGRIARVLADKIAIAAKVDYFKGAYVGDKLAKEVEESL